MFSIEEKKLLLDLFHLYAPSNGEKPVLNFIKKVLDDNEINYKQDNNGNIYCLNYMNEPLLSAHTDCVGTAESGAYVRFINLYPYDDDEILKGIGNIGGDDKCGVFLILLYLISKKPINAIFSVCEEIGGGNGIKSLVPLIKDSPVFKSCPYCLVLDRKNCGDIICHDNDYGSKAFENALEKIGKEFGYSPVKGSISDMNTIKEFMNGCNLSVDYYNPHSTTEFVSLNGLFNTWNYLNKLIEEMPRDLPLEKKETPQTTYRTWTGENNWGSYNYDWPKNNNYSWGEY